MNREDWKKHVMSFKIDDGKPANLLGTAWNSSDFIESKVALSKTQLGDHQLLNRRFEGDEIRAEQRADNLELKIRSNCQIACGRCALQDCELGPEGLFDLVTDYHYPSADESAVQAAQRQEYNQQSRQGRKNLRNYSQALLMGEIEDNEICLKVARGEVENPSAINPSSELLAARQQNFQRLENIADLLTYARRHNQIERAIDSYYRSSSDHVWYADSRLSYDAALRQQEFFKDRATTYGQAACQACAFYKNCRLRSATGKQNGETNLVNRAFNLRYSKLTKFKKSLGNNPNRPCGQALNS